MSLYSDLNEILTPYANKIKELATSDDQIKADLDNLEPGLSDSAKAALLACFRHVALWTDGNGEQYINTLEMALNNEVYPQIRVSFNPGSNVIYTDDAINSIKQYLTVKYYATAQSTGTVVSENDYTISGTLVAGTSVLTVAYNNLVAPVGITNVIDFYNILEWDSSSDLVSLVGKSTGTFPNADGVNTLGLGTSLTTRYSPCLLRGKIPAIDYSTKQFTEYYPFPIPSGASMMNLICDNYPDLEYGPVTWKLDEGTGVYIKKVGYTWTKHNTQLALGSESDFVSFVVRADVNNTNFTDEPIIRIIFE